MYSNVIHKVFIFLNSKLHINGSFYFPTQSIVAPGYWFVYFMPLVQNAYLQHITHANVNSVYIQEVIIDDEGQK